MYCCIPPKKTVGPKKGKRHIVFVNHLNFVDKHKPENSLCSPRERLTSRNTLWVNSRRQDCDKDTMARNLQPQHKPTMRRSSEQWLIFFSYLKHLSPLALNKH